MRTAQYTRAGQVDVGDAHASPPGLGEVSIAVAFVGLCGTDLHIVHGDMDARVTTPHTFGHEMSGTIAAVGPGVSDWRVGEQVTVMPLLWDGTCAACMAGHQHVCQNLVFIGVDSPGALQGLWNVPVSTLVRLPDGMDLQIAALVEPLAVAVHDVRRSGLAGADRSVVLGGGPIGSLIAMVARASGADVLVVEPESTRRGVVEGLGFRTADPRIDDVLEHVTEWTAGAGADVVFEVSGSEAAVLSATSLPRVRGTVVIVAIHPVPRPVDLHRVFWRELRLLGARVYERRDFEEAVRLLAGGAVSVDALVTGIRPLDEITEAISDLQEGRAMKVLVDVAGAQAGTL